MRYMYYIHKVLIYTIFMLKQPQVTGDLYECTDYPSTPRLRFDVLYSTLCALQIIVLYCIVLYCIVLYCIVLYCIVLYCIVLYCIVLYCIVLLYAIHLCKLELGHFQQPHVATDPQAAELCIFH